MNKQSLETVKCNFCKGENLRVLFKGNDYLYFSPLTFKLNVCSDCGLVFLNPRPVDIAEYYAPRGKTQTYDPFLFLNPDIVKIINRVSEKAGRILDIGCGHGYFLAGMKKQGWQTYGNELSSSGYNFAKQELGLENIYNDDLLNIDLPDNFFDIVTMWHTLEHMKQPVEILSKIKRILKDDGVLLIESPNFSSLQSRFFKQKWFALDLPRHLYQFRPKVLRKRLEQFGFKVHKRDYIVNFRINFIDLKNSLSRLLGLHQIPGEDGLRETGAVRGLRKYNTFWKLGRSVFDILILFLSVFFVLIGSDDSFRFYCKKINKGQ